MSKIINFIGPVHMGRQHNGMREVAETNDLSLDRLKRGEFIIFISSKGTRYKAYGPCNAFFDHNLHPVTLEDYLITNDYKIDVGLETPLDLSLSKANMAKLRTYFKVISTTKRERKKKKS